MADRTTWTDQQVDQWIGRMLQFGVLLSAAIIAAGGAWYVAGAAWEPADHRHFDGEPESLREISEIVGSASDLNSRALIQIGLLVLILTPVAQVAFTVFAFVARRDYVFVIITLVVLAVLLATLFGAAYLPG